MFAKIVVVIFVAPFWYVASVLLGQAILLITGRHPSDIDALISGSMLLGAIIFAFHLKEKHRLEVERKKVMAQPCPHDIPGGITANKCTACIDARKLEEIANRKAEQFAQLKREFAKTHNSLRESEMLRLRSSVLPTLADFQKLSSQQFEDAIADLYRRLGFLVTQTPYSNDGGRDAILTRDEKTYLLECKRYGTDNFVGRPEIQKFHSAVITDNAIGGFFVSTSDFTKEACEHATKIQCIKLINGIALQELVFRSGNTNRDDRYSTICLECGAAVWQRLGISTETKCSNGHPVKSSLSFAEVIAYAEPERTCHKCGSSMRLIRGRYGKFWGCNKYPACQSTQKDWPKRRRARR